MVHNNNRQLEKLLGLTVISYTAFQASRQIDRHLTNKTAILVSEKSRALSEMQVKAFQTFCLLKVNRILFKIDIYRGNIIYWKAALWGVYG